MRKLSLPVSLSSVGRRIRGASLTEYGMTVGLIAVLGIGSVLATGEEVDEVFCQATYGVGSRLAEVTGRTYNGPVCARQVAEPGPPPYDPPLDDVLFRFGSGGISVNLTAGPDPAVVTWPDGSSETVPAGTTDTLAFDPGAGPGPHEVLITGSVDVLGQLSTNITEVVSFGRLGIQALDGTFQNADTLASVAPLPPTVTSLHQMMQSSDANPTGMESWDVSNVTDFSSAFYNADGFNGDISGWDTSAATTMEEMFRSADAFNQDISGWNVGSVTTFGWMFTGADLFDQPLGPWDVSGVNSLDDMERMFQGSAMTADLSAWCVDDIPSRPTFFAPEDQLASEPVWGSCGAPANSADDIVLTFDIDTAGTEVRFNRIETTTGATIFWGDGAIEAVPSDDSYDRSFAAAGTYEVRLQGDVQNFQLNSSQAGPLLASVDSWGNTGLTSLEESLAYTDTTLTSVASNLPATVVSLHEMMLGSDANPTGMESWNVSNVTDFSSAFYNADGFNGDISGWDTSAATTMEEMFRSADAFNQDISGWDVGSVTTFGWMFTGADLFDQPLGPWDVSGVNSLDDMEWMFSNSGMTADLSAWCVDDIPSRPTVFAPTGQLAAEPSWGTTVASCP